MLEEQSFVPEKTFMVGDGVRSDINPALALGMHAILVRGQSWAHERVDPLHGDFHAVDGLEEIPGIVFNAMEVAAS